MEEQIPDIRRSGLPRNRTLVQLRGKVWNPPKADEVVSPFGRANTASRSHREPRNRMLTKDRLIRLCKARDQLRSLDQTESSIDKAAKSAAMSRYHFIRQFKAVFGEAPVQFRTRVRLDRAKHLLVYGESSVTDICMEVGFSSLGSFSSLFSRRFGHAPSTYRREFTNSVEKHSPDCMALLRAAWEEKSQISRSMDSCN
jgi:AraC-like DNA-binding protein